MKSDNGDRVNIVPEDLISVIKELTQNSITDPEISVDSVVSNIHHIRGWRGGKVGVCDRAGYGMIHIFARLPRQVSQAN